MANTANYKIYYPTLTTIPDVPADFQKSAESVDTALGSLSGTKQDKPTDNTTVLTYARGQSRNPVTVWSTPQNTTNNPSGGQNLQFEWTDTKTIGWVGSWPNGYRLRLHVDARAGQSGQSLHDIAWAQPEKRVSYGGFGYSQSTNKAVVVAGLNGAQGNDIHLLWLAPYIRAQVDTTWVGDFAYVTPSSARFKDISGRTEHATAGAFVDSVAPARYTYKTDSGLVGAANQGREHLGFIAEEVRDAAAQHALPKDMVQYDGQGQPSSVELVDLVAVLWTTVQDLRQRVTELESASVSVPDSEVVE